MYRLVFLITFGASVAWMYSSPGYEPFIGMLVTVGALLRDEVHGFIGSKFFSLTPRRGVVKDLTNFRYSFVREEYVNPLIVGDLIGWLSDYGDQVISIDVAGANKSNRYHADVTQKPGNPHSVVLARRAQESISYQYLGRSFSGIHLLRVWHSAGGSGVFCSIVLVTVTSEPAVEIHPGSVSRKERLVIKKVGTIPLGDRYAGTVSYRFGLLSIGACTGLATLRTAREFSFVL